MTTPNRAKPGPKRDEATAAIVHTGEATMAQIAGILRTDVKRLRQLAAHVVPVRRTAAGHMVYNVRDVAAVVITPGYEVEEFIRQMSPQELPPQLLKEFWNGQNARLKYEKEVGNLWPTERVAQVMGTLMSAARMANMLLKDTVERETTLTSEQREVLQRIADANMVELRRITEEKMAEFEVLFEGDEVEADESAAIAASYVRSAARREAEVASDDTLEDDDGFFDLP